MGLKSADSLAHQDQDAGAGLYWAIWDEATQGYRQTRSMYMYSLVPRLSCVGGETRAWYTLFAHAQFSQDFLGIRKFSVNLLRYTNLSEDTDFSRIKAAFL